MRENAWGISRFKGLGEMNPEQLKDTTMNPDTRRLSQVRVRAGELEQNAVHLRHADGQGEASSRRSWMEANGNAVEVDI